MSEGQLFDTGDNTEGLAFEELPAGPTVDRRPGWVYVANRHGPQGYHLIKTVTGIGTLVTMCGRIGRKVEEAQRQIIECSACRTAVQP